MSGETPSERTARTRRALAVPEVLLALDFETTGLDSGRDRVIEVGAVRFRLDEAGSCVEEGALACLVDPGMPIPAASRSIHGISDADVEGAPAFAAVLPTLVELAREAVIVAHNAPFDLAFLNAELARLGRPRADNKRADTVLLARRAFPGRASYRLVNLAASLGIAAGAAHRALDDARTCMRLYAACAAALNAPASQASAEASAEPSTRTSTSTSTSA